jgi:peptide deformylase
MVQAGDPVLRGRARMLAPEEIREAEIQRLIEDMRETMRAAPVVGLAAPQVGRGLQLAVIEDRAEYRDRRRTRLSSKAA